MITPQQIKIRVHGIYCPMVKRFGPKNWKSGKRAGLLRVAGQVVPFTEAQLLDWLMARIGLNAIPCPLCGVPIDALSVSLDHIVPASRGGSLGLDNLTPCCAQCNRTKGSLTSIEYRALLALLDELNPLAKADVLNRLKMGAMGARLRYFGKKAA